MKSFFEWFETTKQNPEQPWLVLGKGPSFAKRDQFDLKNFQLLSLNHAVREQPVAVAHMIDFDVVEACGESIGRNATVLVMPWFPHLENRPWNGEFGEPGPAQFLAEPPEHARQAFVVQPQPGPRNARKFAGNSSPFFQ